MRNRNFKNTLKAATGALILGLSLFLMSGDLSAGSDDGWDEADEVLSQLEENMSDIRTLKADFIQEKELAVFKDKIILKGAIFLEHPALFAWRVQEPVRYSLIINGDTLHQWDEDTGEVQRLSLANNPNFQIAIAQMKNWFSGRYASLRGEYQIKILQQNPISLKFIPNKTAITSSVISSITITFREDKKYIHKIQIEEKEGDSTLLTFLNTEINCRFDDATWKAEPHVR